MLEKYSILTLKELDQYDFNEKVDYLVTKVSDQLQEQNIKMNIIYIL